MAAPTSNAPCAPGRADDGPLQASLRHHWLHVLTEAEREAWRDRFSPPYDPNATTDNDGLVTEPVVKKELQKDLVRDMRQQFKVPIHSTWQLTRFRQWLTYQEELAYELEEQNEAQAEMAAKNPQPTFDQVRDVSLQRTFFRGLKGGDFLLGLQSIRAQLQTQKALLELDQQLMAMAGLCQKHFNALKAIHDNPLLSEQEKLDQIRQVLFVPLAGKPPELKFLPAVAAEAPEAAQPDPAPASPTNTPPEPAAPAAPATPMLPTPILPTPILPSPANPGDASAVPLAA